MTDETLPPVPEQGGEAPVYEAPAVEAPPRPEARPSRGEPTLGGRS